MADEHSNGFLVPPDIAEQLWESMESGKVIYGPTFVFSNVKMNRRQRMGYAWRTFRRSFRVHKFRFFRQTLYLAWLAWTSSSRVDVRLERDG